MKPAFDTLPTYREIAVLETEARIKWQRIALALGVLCALLCLALIAQAIKYGGEPSPVEVVE